MRRGSDADATHFERPGAGASSTAAGCRTRFPCTPAGFSFPIRARPGLTPILVHVRTDALHFAVDERKSTYSGQAAIVVRMQDATGQEVAATQPAVRADRRCARTSKGAKQGDILFYRELDLRPRRLHDRVNGLRRGRAAGQRADRDTDGSGRAAARSAMSSLVLVNRVEETSDSAQPDARSRPPLYVGRTLLYPNLGEPISKAAVRELPFYFALYGAAADAVVKAQLLRNGQALAEAPVALNAATGSRVQHVGRLPDRNAARRYLRAQNHREGRGPRALADGLFHFD